MINCSHKHIAGITYENRVEYVCLSCKAKFVPRTELEAVKGERDRYFEAIDDAPHTQECCWHSWTPLNRDSKYCDCWKQAALQGDKE